MMNIQQFNPKMISITMLRKNMQALESVLIKDEEVLVMRNQSVLFVALTPEKYKRMMMSGGSRVVKSVEEAIGDMDVLRKSKKSFKGSPVAGYVSKMRDERAKRWKE